MTIIEAIFVGLLQGLKDFQKARPMGKNNENLFVADVPWFVNR